MVTVFGVTNVEEYRAVKFKLCRASIKSVFARVKYNCFHGPQAHLGLRCLYAFSRPLSLSSRWVWSVMIGMLRVIHGVLNPWIRVTRSETVINVSRALRHMLCRENMPLRCYFECIDWRTAKDRRCFSIAWHEKSIMSRPVIHLSKRATVIDKSTNYVRRHFINVQLRKLLKQKKKTKYVQYIFSLSLSIFNS